MKDRPSEAFPPQSTMAHRTLQDTSKSLLSSLCEVALIFPEIRIILPDGAERIMDTGGTGERSHTDLSYKATVFSF